MRKQKGFTLTELLVVVLIVSILAALVYPLYTKSITKSRAVEAINLLEMVRSKQLQEFARTGAYFNDFSTAGALTSDKSNESVSGATLKVKDYTLSINNATNCVSANYKKGSTNFTFSSSYENAGLGCTGAICTSFGDIIGDAKSVCNCGSKVCTGGFTRNEETCECECNKACNNGSTCSDVSGGGLTRPCPSGCGTQTSTASCGGPVWSGSCTSEYLSLPTSQSCGNGGTQYRICTASCSGGSCGAWGPCTGETIDCTGTKPDTSTSCGNCGTKTRSVTCNDSTGVWETGSWGTCSSQGECSPGETQGCSASTGTQTCSSSCSWGTCIIDPKDCDQNTKPSSSESCGNCGTRSRSVTCNNSTGVWETGTWGTCDSQGVCAPTSANCSSSCQCKTGFDWDGNNCISNSCTFGGWVSVSSSGSSTCGSAPVKGCVEYASCSSIGMPCGVEEMSKTVTISESCSGVWGDYSCGYYSEGGSCSRASIGSSLPQCGPNPCQAGAGYKCIKPGQSSCGPYIWVYSGRRVCYDQMTQRYDEEDTMEPQCNDYTISANEITCLSKTTYYKRTCN